MSESPGWISHTGRARTACVVAVAIAAAAKRPPQDDQGFLRVVAVGLLVAGPIVLVLCLGWALYGGTDAATFWLVFSGVSVLLGLTPALFSAS